jgi:hypothetical protein
MERMTERVTPWIEAALKEHALGQRGTWEVSFGMAQTPQGMIAVLMLYLAIPAALIGSVHAHITQMPLPAVEANVKEAVRQMTTELLERRKAELATPNGHVPGPLHVPGR